MSDDPILAALARIESGQGDLMTRVGGLESGQGALMTRMGGIETRMGGIETRVGGIETRMGGIETRVGGIETRVGGIEAEQTRLRVDLMARMDRLQTRLDGLDEHLTLGLGHSDRVDHRAQGIAEENRIIGEQLISMQKLLKRLEGRINDLEERQ